MKKFLLFYFLQFIIIKMILFIVIFTRFKLFNILLSDSSFEIVQWIYDIFLNPVIFLFINAVLTSEQNRKSNIINILFIIICLFIGIKLSRFTWEITSHSNDWEHGMIYVLQLYIFIPLYCIIGLIEHIILIIIFNRKQKK
jgi:hypothetical protein